MNGTQATPRLNYVMGELTRTFRPHRPVRVDPESKRNEFTAMCCVCPWQREFENSGTASDEAMKHGRAAHGDPFLGFVRIDAR